MSNYIMGSNTVSEVLQIYPERIKAIFTTKDFLEKNNNLTSIIKENNYKINFLDKKSLSELVNSESHQNIIALTTHRNTCSVKDFLSKNKDSQKSLVFILDSIYDPHNFGAILRVAECFGLDGVIFKKKDNSGITPVVSKTSSGASEIVNLMAVSNLNNCIKLFKENGYWVISTDLANNAASLDGFDFPEKSVVILGSEGKGVSKILSSNSDFNLQISLKGKINSLNVAQSSAILAYSYNKSITS